MKLSTLVKEYREEHNMSGRSFAKACGVSHSYISQLESEIIKSPTMTMLKKISKGMGYDFDDFINMLDDDIVVTVKAKPVDEKEGFLLSDNEIDLIEKYRNLTEPQMKIIDDLINQFAKEKQAP